MSNAELYGLVSNHNLVLIVAGVGFHELLFAPFSWNLKWNSQLLTFCIFLYFTPMIHLS